MSAFAPFDASKYAFRTNFDGLTARDAASSARVEQAKRAYQNALEKFENQDKKARKEYQQAKNAGLTTESFEDWVHSNFYQWANAKAELQCCGANLTQAGMDAFGHVYTERLGEGESNLAIAAQQASYRPENL